MSNAHMFVAGLVLAAGSSRRLGQPKQLLAFGDATLLDATLATVRDAPFDQRLVTIGGAGPDVINTVNFDGFDVVESLHYSDGCSSSIVSSLAKIDADANGFVLLLGDQPKVTITAIDALIAAASEGHPIAVCRYDDGIGHPFWFGRETFSDLAQLHGDKAVWKVIESGTFAVHEVTIAGNTPLDVDTWDDYELLLAQDKLDNSGIIS